MPFVISATMGASAAPRMDCSATNVNTNTTYHKGAGTGGAYRVPTTIHIVPNVATQQRAQSARTGIGRVSSRNVSQSS